MKKSFLCVLAVALFSLNSIPSNAQDSRSTQAFGGTNPVPQSFGGTNPVPQVVFPVWFSIMMGLL